MCGARQMPTCEKDYCYYYSTKTIMPNNVMLPAGWLIGWLFFSPAQLNHTLRWLGIIIQITFPNTLKLVMEMWFWIVIFYCKCIRALCCALSLSLAFAHSSCLPWRLCKLVRTTFEYWMLHTFGPSIWIRRERDREGGEDGHITV